MSQLQFGIYPGGPAGGDQGLLVGPPDDPERVRACLDELQGSAPIFVVRCYDSFQDPRSPFEKSPCAPANYSQYAIGRKRPMDLVLQFRSESGDVAGFVNFVRAQIQRHAAYLYSVQIAEEPNFKDGPKVIDGPYPNVLQAVREGMIAAKTSFPDLKVGFNATPTFGPTASFWAELRGIEVDFVGLDFFPDVFRRSNDLRADVTGVLEAMRHTWLPSAGIGDQVPIHITENGWPTSAGRTWEQQAATLKTVIRTIQELSDRLNIVRYSLFALRDVDHPTAATADNLFLFFGITGADYARKPAFEVYRSFIAESVHGIDAARLERW